MPQKHRQCSKTCARGDQTAAWHMSSGSQLLEVLGFDVVLADVAVLALPPRAAAAATEGRRQERRRASRHGGSQNRGMRTRCALSTSQPGHTDAQAWDGHAPSRSPAQAQPPSGVWWQAARKAQAAGSPAASELPRQPLLPPVAVPILPALATAAVVIDRAAPARRRPAAAAWRWRAPPPIIRAAAATLVRLWAAAATPVGLWTAAAASGARRAPPRAAAASHPAAATGNVQTLGRASRAVTAAAAAVQWALGASRDGIQAVHMLLPLPAAAGEPENVRAAFSSS